MNEVEHFFDMEIEQAEERIDNEDTMFFNGVKVSKAIGKELNEKHISFCESAKRALKMAVDDRNCQIKEMKHHIDRLEADKSELRTRCKERAMDNFDNHLYGLLNIVDAEELHQKFELPTEPIKVAEMLIDAESEHKKVIHHMSGDRFSAYEETYKMYSKSELCQIAIHLLVYCGKFGE